MGTVGTPGSKSPLPIALDGRVAAMDFGGTNFDVLVSADGEATRRFFPAGKPLGADVVRELLERSGVSDLTTLRWIAVTGGRHQFLPDQIQLAWNVLQAKGWLAAEV